MIGQRAGRIFALLALVSLVLAPIARPVMALAAPAVARQMADASIAPASEKMPCCPSKHTLPDCDKDCPFMALCAGMVIHAAPPNTFAVALVLAAIVSPGEASILVSVAHTPPRKPPKA